MNKQPEVYTLEFFSDADFWAQAPEEARRVFIMPVANPVEFLAFGVHSPSKDVHFVARGQVAEHLGEFLARMVRDKASAEVYARAPLPDSIVNRFIEEERHDQAEGEPPPPPPIQSGAVVTAGGELSLTGLQTTLFPQDSFPQRVLAVPLAEPNEYLVFGLRETNDGQFRYRVPFVAWVADLDAFTELVREQGFSGDVEITTTPLEFLQGYVDAFRENLGGTGSLARAA